MNSNKKMLFGKSSALSVKLQYKIHKRVHEENTQKKEKCKKYTHQIKNIPCCGEWTTRGRFDNSFKITATREIRNSFGGSRNYCYLVVFVQKIQKSDKTAPKMKADMTTSKILTAMKSLRTQHENLTFLTETSFSLTRTYTHTHTYQWFAEEHIENSVYLGSIVSVYQRARQIYVKNVFGIFFCMMFFPHLKKKNDERAITMYLKSKFRKTE